MKFLYNVFVFLSIIALIVFPIIIFALCFITWATEKYPLKTISELEKQIVIIEEAFKIKYPNLVSEHAYMFDDEEWDVTVTKKVTKQLFVKDDIWSCSNGFLVQNIEKLERCYKKCRTPSIKLFSSVLNYVYKRRLRAIGRYNNVIQLYNEISKS